MRGLFVCRWNFVDLVNIGAACGAVATGRGWWAPIVIILVLFAVSTAGEHHYGIKWP